MKRRMAVTALFFCLLLFFAACTGDSSGYTVRYALSGPVENMDPQFATEKEARLILANVYECLVTPQPDGSLLPGAALAWEEDGDGLSYRFFLREDGVWADGTPVTAADFVFTFRRMFSEQALSPYAQSYMAIRGARQVALGELGVSALGVRAVADYQLEILLEQPDPQFLAKLGEPAAAPCSQVFFESSGGRYGLERAYLMGNGPFEVSYWDNSSQIRLKASGAYHSAGQVPAGGVTFLIPQEGGAAPASDLYRVTDEEYAAFSRATGKNRQLEAFEDTSWCLVFNQAGPVWGNALLRLSLAHGIDLGELRELLPQSLRNGQGFVPQAVMLGGSSFRAQVGDNWPVDYDPEKAARFLEAGLEAERLPELPVATVYVPEAGVHSKFMAKIQRDWQRNLGVLITIEQEPAAAIEARLRSGNYEILLFPFSPADGQLSSLMGVFTSDSGQNYFGYRSEVYDSILAQAAAQGDGQAQAALYAWAEWQLLSEATVIPLYGETTYYATQEGVSGLQVFPYGGRIDFRGAVKE